MQRGGGTVGHDQGHVDAAFHAAYGRAVWSKDL